MSRMLSKSKSGSWFTVAGGGHVGHVHVCRPVRAEVFTPTQHSALQAVYDDGTSAWSGQPGRPTFHCMGIVINNPWDMLNYSSSRQQHPARVASLHSGSRTRVISAEQRCTCARTSPGILPIRTMDDLEWYSGNGTVQLPGSIVRTALQRGDLIRVDARAPGLFYGGKFNINEQHSKDSREQFRRYDPRSRT